MSSEASVRDSIMVPRTQTRNAAAIDIAPTGAAALLGPATSPRVRTRGEWLLALVDELRPSFAETGHPLPVNLRVTCGWPSTAALSRLKRRIGECWPPAASADNTVEIFISPFLGDAIDVAETLVHELVHAAGAMGHRGQFPKVAKAVGLAKPWRATSATAALRERLNGLIVSLGPYPHAALDASMTPHKKGGTRLVKLMCLREGYTARTTRKWIDFGLPRCPCGMVMTEIPR